MIPKSGYRFSDKIMRNQVPMIGIIACALKGG
jgi:hypothetical protein